MGIQTDIALEHYLGYHSFTEYFLTFDFLQSEFREIILVKLQRCDNSDFMVALASLLQDFISFFSSFIHEKILCCTVCNMKIALSSTPQKSCCKKS